MSRWLVWAVGPGLTFVAAFAVAYWFAQKTATGASSDPGEALLAQTLEDLVWASGSPGDVRTVLHKGPARSLGTAESERALRTRLRLAVVAQTPDARAALLSEACALEPLRCDSLPQELERVAATRPGQREYHLVAPSRRDQR
jgi:hypothetical protein